MAVITRDQFLQLLKEAPKGTSPEQLRDKLLERGHSFEGYTPQDSLTVVKKQQEQGHRGVGGFLVGAFKGAANTVSNLQSFGQKSLEKITGIKASTPTMKEAAGDLLTPQGTAEKIGFGAEQIGEFFIPGSAATKAGKAVEVFNQGSKVPKIVQATTKLLAKSGTEAVTSAGITAMQGGDAGDIKTAAGIGFAFPFAGKALSKLGGAAVESSKFLAKSLSGVPEEAIVQAFKNPEAVSTAIRTAASEGGEATAQKIYSQAIDALNLLKQSRSKAYEANLEALEKTISYNKKGQMYIKRALTEAEAKATKGYSGGEILVPTNLSTKGVKDIITKTVKQFGGNAKGKALDFSEMAIDSSHAKKLQELVGRVYKWNNVTPKGFNKLTQIIDSYRVGGVNLGSSEKQFNAIVGTIKENLSSYLTQKVPTVGKLRGDYHAQSQVIDNIVNQLKLGKGDPNTALRKLVNVFNPKSEVYRPVVKELGEKAGVDLMSDIAGLVMSRWTPEGLGKYVTTLVGGGLGGASLANPTAALALVPTAAAASPRVVGKVATTAGKVVKDKTVKAVGNIIKKTTKGVVIKSQQ